MRTTTLFAAGLGALMIGTIVLEPSLAETSPAMPDSAQTALTSQGETTVGRRLLMHSIGSHNDIIHDILDGVLPMDDLELRGRLQSISSMLYAFPSLYRAAPNPFSVEGEAADAARVSLANAKVWEDFDTFKLLAFDAYLKAQEAADAPPDQMLERVVELETMCEGCHEVYRTPFKYFDFDHVEDFIEP